MINVQAITADQIQKVYSGKPGCMCGCKGKYSYNPIHRVAGGKERGYTVTDEDVNLKSVNRILKLLKEQMTVLEVEVEVTDQYLYAEIGTRCYAAYFQK